MSIERDEPMFELVDEETARAEVPAVDERAPEDDEDDRDGEE